MVKRAWAEKARTGGSPRVEALGFVSHVPLRNCNVHAFSEEYAEQVPAPVPADPKPGVVSPIPLKSEPPQGNAVEVA